MARHRMFPLAIAATAAVLTACATQAPVSTPSPSLLERKFQQAASTYRQYLYQGQTVYCRKEKPITSMVPALQCLTESQLRAQVENYQRTRNSVQRPVVGTISSIG